MNTVNNSVTTGAHLTLTLSRIFRPTTYRWARAAKYLLFVAVGIFTLFVPTNVISLAFADYIFLAYIWSALLLVGAIVCFVGIATRTWVGEYVGLPLVITCLLLYSLGCFVGVPVITGGRIFLGLVFAAFTFSSIARRQDVAFQKRLADYDKRVRAGLPGL